MGSDPLFNVDQTVPGFLNDPSTYSAPTPGGKRRARTFSQAIADATRGLDAGMNGPGPTPKDLSSSAYKPDWRGHYEPPSDVPAPRASLNLATYPNPADIHPLTLQERMAITGEASQQTRLASDQWATKYDDSEERDERGRWTGPGSFTAYHGTLKEYVHGIEKHGIKVEAKNRNFDKEYYQGDRGESVYITNDLHGAESWAKNASRNSYGNTNGMNSAVFRVEIPHDERGKLVTDEMGNAQLDPHPHNLRFEGKIKPEWIKGVRTFDGEKWSAEHILAKRALLNINGKPLVIYLCVITQGPQVEKFDEGELRDSHGEWTSGGLHTSDVNEAANALAEGKRVELAQPREVSTLLDQLGAQARAAEAAGKEAPVVNMCNVSAAGTNLFCAGNKGIPRAKMPQMDDAETAKFKQFLADKGYSITDEDEAPEMLRPTQNEINGAAVGKLMGNIRSGNYDPTRRILVSRDNYILDGHHYWAARVGLDDEAGAHSNMMVTRVDAPITTLLRQAKDFGARSGSSLASAAVGKFDASQARDAHGRWTQTGTQAFKDWFKDSKVTDRHGVPERMYHGTMKDFAAFDPAKINSNYPYSIGFHFSDKPQDANVYGEPGEHDDRTGGNIVPVYLSVQHPLTFDLKGDYNPEGYADVHRDEIMQQVEASRETAKPYDGVIINTERNGKNVIVFDPTKVKSAIGNSGKFDPSDPDMTKFDPDQARDDHGRWTQGGGSSGAPADLTGDTGLLAGAAQAARHDAFEAKYGKDVTGEADRLAEDWYTMRPTSHLDAFLTGKLQDGAEKQAWTAIEADTQSRLASEVKGDTLDLYRGIPGQDAVNAFNAAKESGAEYAVIPVHDSLNHTHEAVCATGDKDLAEGYAATRWARHGGDPAQAHMGIVMHMQVPKTDVVFSTAHSAFTNPYTKGWNEYVVRTGGATAIRLPMKDIEVVGVAKALFVWGGQGKGDATLPLVLPVRLHPAEAKRGFRKYDPDELRDAAGRWTETGAGGDYSGALEQDRAMREDTAYDQAYSPWEEDKNPIPERGDLTGMQFSSSSLHEKQFAEAKDALTGERQLAFDKASTEIDAKLGMAGVEHSDVIGAWADGAENSNMAEIRAPGSLEQLRLSAAMKGSLANQKAVLVFQTAPEGHDTLYTMAAPGTPESLHADLLKAGIPYHTLVTYPAGKDENLTRVIVVDTDGGLGDKVEKFADAHGTAALGYNGHAEFLGDTQGTGSDAEQRERAQKAYSQVIAQATGRYQDGDARAVWQGVRDRWADRLAALKRAFASFLDRHLGKYSPDQPRGKDGKWSSGGDNAPLSGKPKWKKDQIPRVFYHGSAESAVDDVMKHGLIPHGGHGADTWGSEHTKGFKLQAMTAGDRHASVYITTSPSAAGYFAELAADENKSKPAIFEISIPAKEVKAHVVYDEHAEADMQAYRFKGKIKPDWINPLATDDFTPDMREGVENASMGVDAAHHHRKADSMVFYVVMPTIGGKHKPITAS